MNIEKFIAILLPPSKREQVLGDLAERHGNRTSSIGYLRDALQVVPPIAWRAFWRLSQPQPAGVEASVALLALRRRAEEVQDELWQRRALRVLLLCAFWMLAFVPPRWGGWAANLRALGFYGFLVAFSVDAVRRWMKFRPQAIPASITLADLISVHHRGLSARKLPDGSLPGLNLYLSYLLLLLRAPNAWTVISAGICTLALFAQLRLAFPLIWANITGEPYQTIEAELKALNALRANLTE